MRPRSRLAPLLPFVLATAVACGGDGDGKDRPKAGRTPQVALTLPPGELADAVVQPDEVPDGVVPLLAQTGPADIEKIASFSADPKLARTSLVEHGFDAAYVATYGDEATGRIVVSVVTRFTSEKGATDDLSADLAATTGTAVTVEDLGEQAGGVRAALHPDTGKGELVTVRWRRDATTFLLAVGAEGTVDEDAVLTLARKVDARAG